MLFHLVSGLAGRRIFLSLIAVILLQGVGVFCDKTLANTHDCGLTSTLQKFEEAAARLREINAALAVESSSSVAKRPAYTLEATQLKRQLADLRSELSIGGYNWTYQPTVVKLTIRDSSIDTYRYLLQELEARKSEVDSKVAMQKPQSDIERAKQEVEHVEQTIEHFFQEEYRFTRVNPRYQDLTVVERVYQVRQDPY